MEQVVSIQTFTPDALGVSSGKPILIPFTLKGEEVEISEKIKKKGMRFARPLRVLKPSKDRIDPFCPQFGECGGCLVQHLDYEKELLWKEETIQNYFSCFDNLDLLPIIRADKLQGWRGKMEFHFSLDGELGLYHFFGKRTILDLYSCSIGPDWFQEAINEIRKLTQVAHLTPFNPNTGKGSLRSLTLRHGHRTGDRMILLTISGEKDNGWNQHQIEAFKKVGEQFSASLFLILENQNRHSKTTYQEKHLLGKKYIEEKLTVMGRELSFRISPRAFFQPNPVQAEKLYQKVFDLLDLSGNETLFDLYSGTGTLALFAAPFVQKVVSIELSQEACNDARINRDQNNLTNVEVMQGNVEHILKEKRSKKPDVVLVDPPRNGLDPQAIVEIIRLNPPKIGYISCNPKSQVADLKSFIESGYKLSSVQPVDQFPRSPHLENIAILKKV